MLSVNEQYHALEHKVQVSLKSNFFLSISGNYSFETVIRSMKYIRIVVLCETLIIRLKSREPRLQKSKIRTLLAKYCFIEIC